MATCKPAASSISSPRLLRTVVLASASPRRLELLSSLGLSVEIRPSGYHEPDDPLATPLELAVAHARNKLVYVLRQDDTSLAPLVLSEPSESKGQDDTVLRQAQDDNGGVVIAADTVVDLDGKALNKPGDAAEAASMLRSLSGREHLVHTAFALRVPGNDVLVEEHSTTRVRFYPLSVTEVADYVATGEPMDKAGAYGIQGRAAALVESIDGDFYTVMGFPLARFVRTLRALGFSLPIAKETPSR